MSWRTNVGRRARDRSGEGPGPAARRATRGDVGETCRPTRAATVTWGARPRLGNLVSGAEPAGTAPGAPSELVRRVLLEHRLERRDQPRQLEPRDRGGSTFVAELGAVRDVRQIVGQGSLQLAKDRTTTHRDSPWCAANGYPVPGSSCGSPTHASNCFSNRHPVARAFGDAAGLASSLRCARRILQLAVHDRVKGHMAPCIRLLSACTLGRRFASHPRKTVCPSENINVPRTHTHKEVIHVARSQPDGPPSSASGQAA